MSSDCNKLYEFADFRFDGRTGKLSRNGTRIPLAPKATELLALLLLNSDRYLEKDEIFETVWKDTFVEDGVLTQNIYVLRKVLGKNADGESLIENKPRLGYRISPPVSITDRSEHIGSPNIGTGIAAPLPISQKMSYLVVAAVVAILAIVVLVAGWQFVRPSVAALLRKPVESVKFTRVTDSGNLSTAVISPDGGVVAFTSDSGAFLKDLETGKEIKIDTAGYQSVGALRFAPDGNSYYFRDSRVLSTQSAIYRISKFGGPAERLIERSWGSFSVSPDGNKIAYFLNVPPVARFNLHIRDMSSGEEREIPVTEQPQSPCAVCSPAWSPDSSTILFSVNTPNGTGQLFSYDLRQNEKKEIKLDKLRRFGQAAWLPDGESYLISASEGTRFFHVWKAYYPDGQIEQLTNGLSNYGNISISADGKKVISVRADETADIFVAPADDLNEAKQVTFGGQNSFGQNGLHWIDDRRLLFSSQTEQNLADNLSVFDLASNSRVQITNESQNAYRVPVSNGKNIWYAMNKNGVSHIFQMNTDGKDVKQLSSGDVGQRQSPRITSDSRYLYYVHRTKDGGRILRYDLVEQKEEVFFDNPEFQPGPYLELSRDNKFLTFPRVIDRPENTETSGVEMAIVSVESLNDIKHFRIDDVPTIRRFSPDSRSIEYISAPSKTTQIVRQRFDGSPPVTIFTAKNGKVFNFAWSKDGRQLALSIGRQNRDAVLLSGF
jgi:Tol biopolymer transport system component/DNA-binding winged helix-turn-helix (wHTH) protein